MFATGLRISFIWVMIGMALAMDCPNPPKFENSHFKVNANVVTYQCDGGFKFEGETRNFTCKKGSWVMSKFICQKTCGVPNEFTGKKIIHSEEELVIYRDEAGSNMTLKCQNNVWTLEESGYDMSAGSNAYENGNMTIVPDGAVFCDDPNAENSTCIPRRELNDSSLCIDGLISGTNISCISSYFGNCSEPMNIPDSTKQIDNEGNVTYTCKPGYIQVGDISTSFCENGTWTETNMNCIPGDFGNCLEPMNIPDSTKQIDNEGNVTYACKPGYIQVGDISTSFCENGTWTETNMNCVPESCGQLPYVESSRVYVDGYIANFTCEPEFLLIGNVSVSICENDSWSDVYMICVSKAAIALEKKLRQRSEEFQKKIENSTSLICSFLENEQICKCNNRSATMSKMSNKKIAFHDYMDLKVTSEEECDNFCLEDERCLSSEFTKNEDLCQLSNTTMYLVDKMLVFNAQGVIYKEKICIESDKVEEQYPAFNLSTVSPDALLCNMDENELYCGCIGGRISSKIQLNKKITKHNMLCFKTSDSRECSHRCEEVPNCLSAEYKQYKNVCCLSQTAHYLTENSLFKDSPKTQYFEKTCTPFSGF